jgi:hypothetical protein
MQVPQPTSRSGGDGRSASRTLVWIDAREAIVVHWADREVSVERIESEVPEHHKASGLVRRQPHYAADLMSGGYGHPHTSAERHRLEHLARFLDQVAEKVGGDDEALHIIGPGTVREQLERLIREADVRHRRTRTLTCDPARRLTERQLVARARALAGDLPIRRTVGAYRWTGEAATRTSGAAAREPRRVVRKPPDVRAEIEEAEAAAETAEELAEPEVGPAPRSARGRPGPKPAGGS